MAKRLIMYITVAFVAICGLCYGRSTRICKYNPQPTTKMINGTNCYVYTLRDVATGSNLVTAIVPFDPPPAPETNAVVQAEANDNEAQGEAVNE